LRLLLLQIRTIIFRGRIKFANAKQTNAKANSKRENNQNKLREI